jgi:Predicted Na+-dependent transporter
MWRPDRQPRAANMRRLLADRFLLALLGAVALSSVLPVSGALVEPFNVVADITIALVFFLQGARLSRATVVAGFTHWRLHLVVFAATFVLFPLLGLAAAPLVPALLSPALYTGILFLCVLPSTIQSSIAFTSIAHGNVAAAVCSASASNIIGMFLTPLLVGLLFSARGGGPTLEAVGSILLQLLLPFVIGQILQPKIGKWVIENRRVLGLVDRGSILLVVYLAFSHAVVQGLWNKLSAADLAVMVGVDVALLALVLVTTTVAARLLGFSREDEITIVFCGSKKSLASGVPMANVIFSGQDIGIILLPVMLFHQIQLMACAALAQRYADRRLAEMEKEEEAMPAQA